MIKNRNFCKKFTAKPCKWCGNAVVNRNASHIVDEASNEVRDKEDNLINLCPNCHALFDEVIKPTLFRAITLYSGGKVPSSWKVCSRVRKDH